jgi:FtsP/CotA-like multicopper oxidase with cupredoxin domain
MTPRTLAALAVVFSLAACNPSPQDPYDVSKMDLKPVPAKVSAERHKGKFAEGASLSTGAELKPLDPSPVKTVRLDTTHKIIEIAPGVKFSAWTFGDQVPGPTVRARVGDKIRFSMTNRSDEPVPGIQMVAAPMMHSMDFHAAMVSPQDKYRSIAPGQTIEFEFTLNYPGIFMYHCGTPMILEHIASGMYGAVIVEPRNGYPTKADREYIVVQSEFYAKPPAQDLEHHNIPATATPTDPDAVAGKLAFESKCLACHTIGGGKKLGPDLAGVTKHRDVPWLTRWLKDPEGMLKTDPHAKQMLKEYNNIPMPNQSLTDAEVKQFIKYFQWYDAQPKGSAAASHGAGH